VVEWTRRGLPVAEIARRLGVTERTVHRHRNAADCLVRSPWRPFSVSELALAEALFDDGASAKEVARTLGRSASGIARRFPDRAWTRHQTVAHAVLCRRYRAV
jgi:IS30 family transposase